MGYLENFLSKYLVRLGIEVHVVTMDLPPYYQMEEKEFKTDLPAGCGFRGPDSRDRGIVQGFTLHVLPHRKVLGYMQMSGLRKKLASIRPDIVQTRRGYWVDSPASGSGQTFSRLQAFTANHHHCFRVSLAPRSFLPGARNFCVAE